MQKELLSFELHPLLAAASVPTESGARCLASECEIPADVSGKVHEEQSCRWKLGKSPRAIPRFQTVRAVRFVAELPVTFRPSCATSRAQCRSSPRFLACNYELSRSLRVLTTYIHVSERVFYRRTYINYSRRRFDRLPLLLSPLNTGFVTLPLERVACKSRPSDIFHPARLHEFVEHAPTVRSS